MSDLSQRLSDALSHRYRIEREIGSGGMEEGNQNLPYIGTVSFFRPFHDNPRFQALAEEVGVPLLTPEGGGT